MANTAKQSALGILLFLSISYSTFAEQVWSPWYNSSPGDFQSVEDETLDRIALTFHMPCTRAEMVAVQCRQVNSNETFSGQFRYRDNVLLVPCNLTGLMCRNHDQILAGTSKCADYEVRVLCVLTEKDTNQNHHDDTVKDEFTDLGANGGFIAMAAGGSVVVPLICILVIQLRKSKREERQRREEARRAADDAARAEEAARLADAPPAYEELFGRHQSVAVISDGAVGVTSGSEQRRGSRERLVNTHSEQLEGRVNHGASLDLSSHTSLSSMVSSSSPVDAATSTDSSSLSSVSTDTSGLDNVAAGTGQTRSDSTSSSSSDAPTSSSSDGTVRHSAFTPSTSSSASSSDVVQPFTISGNYGPPPAYDWPGPSDVTVVVPGQNVRDRPSRHSGSGPSPDSTAPAVVTTQPSPSGVVVTQGRRFLGMHLSIFDLMTVIYPDPTPTPPPTYDDALKILGVHTQPAVQVT